MYRKSLITLLSVLTLATQSAFAYFKTNQDQHFHFSLVPFLWNLNMTGNVGLSGKDRDISRNQLSGMVYFDVQKNNLGLFLSTIYSALTQQYRGNTYTAKISNHYGILNSGLFYDILDSPMINETLLHIIPYGGVRYTIKNTDATIKTRWFTTKTQHDKRWIDPLLGINFNFELNHNWNIVFGGDLGGTNRAHDYSYYLLGLVSYSKSIMSSTISLYLGYQTLYQHFVEDKNNFKWNMKLQGPVVGVGIQM